MRNIFDDGAIPKAPELSEEVWALINIVGVKLAWSGDGWYCETALNFWYVSKKTVTLDQWRAVLDSVIRAEPSQPSS